MPQLTLDQLDKLCELHRRLINAGDAYAMACTVADDFEAFKNWHKADGIYMALLAFEINPTELQQRIDYWSRALNKGEIA